MKLGIRQIEMLKSICSSNGGGVYVSIDTDRVAQSLEKKGLIQGKSGAQYKAVHTPAGMKLYRERYL